jgi:conjugal transfer pilus assembly protein TraF
VSQAFAQVVKAFAAKYHWEVLAISIDGTKIEGFSHIKENNGIAEQLGISKYPCLIVVNPKTQALFPVAFGPVSLDQIETNIALQFQKSKEPSHG